MALVKLTCLLLAIMSLAWSIQGASFSNNVDKNATFHYPNASAIPVPFKPQDLLADLQAAASENVGSVTGTTVTSTFGQQVPPPVSAPAYKIPSYAQSYAQSSGSSAVPPVGPALPPPLPPATGFPFLFPGKWGNFNLDINGGGYFPIVEKVIVVVGGGIFLLLILALIQGSLMKGGALWSMGHGMLSSFADPVDVQSGFSASASTNINKNVELNNRVQDGINKKF